jgi:alkylation response protein AidB-like acyl-CoA dehydrogenase
MILNLTDQEQTFLGEVRSFVEAEVRPFHREWEKLGGWPDSLFKKMAQLGLIRIVIPTEFGGLNYSCQCYVEAVRLVAHGDGALAMNVAALNALAAGHLIEFASYEQKEKYLHRVSTADVLLAWALTEPTAGSDARGVRTRAVPDTSGKHGPDRYLLNGEKMFITNAARAQLVIVIARYSDDDLAAFLVETDQPGFRVTCRNETTGVKASYTTQFVLEDAVGWRTPGTFEECISLLYRGRMGIAAMSLGLAEVAFEAAVKHAKTREQFGKPLAKNQAIQWMIADSATEIEASRLLLHKAARLFDEGKPMVTESSQAKLFASETACRVTDRALQIHGGRGYTPEYDVEKYWRDARLTEIGEGSSEVQRIIISKRELR